MISGPQQHIPPQKCWILNKLIMLTTVTRITSIPDHRHSNYYDLQQSKYTQRQTRLTHRLTTDSNSKVLQITNQYKMIAELTSYTCYMYCKVRQTSSHSIYGFTP